MRPRFRDEVVIRVRSGKGGPGGISFHREKFKRVGPPDGGDGGDGGSIIFRADSNFINLNNYNPGQLYSAEPGDPGDKTHRSGAQGKDVILKVPIGTSVYAQDKDELIAILNRKGDEIVAAKGGMGGKGNAFFKSPTRRSPYFSQKGREGESLEIRLELKLIADAGFIGFPNAGKSTMLSRLTRATPKIADYPFTTLSPNLGTLQQGDRRWILADMPGLIENAHKGAGLGLSFLRHIERVKVIIYVLDPLQDPVSSYSILRNELECYSKKLLDRPSLIVLNKIDLPDAKKKADEFKEQTGSEILKVSGLIGTGIPVLEKKILSMLKKGEKHGTHSMA